MKIARDKNRGMYSYFVKKNTWTHTLIGASRSEPHTNHHYEKIAVLMYVSIYVAIRRPRVHHARACSARGNDLYRIKYVHVQLVKIVNVIICVRIQTLKESQEKHVQPRNKEV